MLMRASCAVCTGITTTHDTNTCTHISAQAGERNYHLDGPLQRRDGASRLACRRTQAGHSDLTSFLPIAIIVQVRLGVNTGVVVNATNRTLQAWFNGISGSQHLGVSASAAELCPYHHIVVAPRRG